MNLGGTDETCPVNKGSDRVSVRVVRLGYFSCPEVPISLNTLFA
jgi:hypothetical protein